MMRHYQVSSLYALLRCKHMYMLLRPVERLVDVNHFCSKSNGDSEPPLTKEFFDGVELPEEPTNCCMSGCANCVWIQYAKELKTIFSCSNEKTREIILKKISDPSMKAFLDMELMMMEKD